MISSHTTISGADRVRMAIAIVALKFKPADQSFDSYVLDLRTKFKPSTPLAPTNDGSWRTHATNLEKKYADLLAKYEAEQIKSLASVKAPASVTLPAGPPDFVSAPIQSSQQLKSSTSTSDAAKKKIKKKGNISMAEKKGEGPVPLDFKSMLTEGLNPLASPNIADMATKDYGALFSAMDPYMTLVSLPKTSEVPQPLLLSALFRAIEAISHAFEMVLSSSFHSSFHLKMLETLNILACYVTSTALPLIMRLASLNHNPTFDTFLGQLLTRIFYPIVRSFMKFSHRYFEALLRPNNPIAPIGLSQSGRTEHNSNASISTLDLRRTVLSLLRSLLLCLYDHAASLTIDLSKTIFPTLETFQTSLFLETIRELDRVLTNNGIGDPNIVTREQENIHTYRTGSHKQGDAHRIQRLAVKDVTWYLLTTLHILSEIGTSHNLLVLNDNEIPDSNSCSKNPQSPDANSGKDMGGEERALRMLRDTISETLFSLVLKCRKKVQTRIFNSYNIGGTKGRRFPERVRQTTTTSTNDCATKTREKTPELDRDNRGNVTHVGIEDSGNQRANADSTNGNSHGKGREDTESRSQERGALGALREGGIRRVVAAGETRDVVYDNVGGMRAASDPEQPQAAMSVNSSLDSTSEGRAGDDRDGHFRQYLIDEVGYEMLLGFLEQFIIGSVNR